MALAESDKTHGHISSEILKLTSIYLLSEMLDEKLCSLINRVFCRRMAVGMLPFAAISFLF